MIEIDQKENPAEAGQVFMLGALYGQPLGGSGGTWGPSSRLNPYLVGQCPGSIPVLPRPRPATKHRDALAAPSTWGIGWEGEGARGGPRAFGRPWYFRHGPRHASSGSKASSATARTRGADQCREEHTSINLRRRRAAGVAGRRAGASL